MMRPTIALAMGDPAGISPELTARLPEGPAGDEIGSSGAQLIVGTISSSYHSVLSSEGHPKSALGSFAAVSDVRAASAFS